MDMPSIGIDSNGKTVQVTFTNVRHVPAFDFTLLSVKQMWREQSIGSKFAHVNSLLLQSRSLLPFIKGRDLPTLKLESTISSRTSQKSTPPSKEARPLSTPTSAPPSTRTDVHYNLQPDARWQTA